MSDNEPVEAAAAGDTGALYQAIACRKSAPDDAAQEPPRKGFDSAEAAAERCKALGHDTSDMEEHDDAYVFHQRAAPECKSSESVVEDIEDGIKGIKCGPDMKADAADDANPGANPYAQIPEQKAGNAPILKETSDGDGDGGGERHQIETGEDEPVSRVPAGAQFIKSYCDYHDGASEIHAANKGMFDNPPLAEAADQWAGDDTARGEEMRAILGDLYPDVEFQDDDDDEPAVEVIPVKAVKGATSVKDMGDDDDAGGGEMTMAAMPDSEMLPGAKYLSALASHVDSGQALLRAGLAKQENPAVKDFAANELERLDGRKEACKSMMEEHYPDEVAKAFPEPGTEPSPPPAPPAPEAKAGPKPGKTLAVRKGGAESSTDLLRQVVKGLAELTAAVTKQLAPAKAAPVAEPEPVDTELAKQLAALQETVAGLVENEMQFSKRLASKVGVNGVKKKGHCDCGGCGTCRTKSRFFDAAKDLSATDDAAGGALVPPPDTETDKCGGMLADNKACVLPKGHDGDCSSVLPAVKKDWWVMAQNRFGKQIVLPLGTPVPFHAKDFSVVDDDGISHDGRVYASFEDAEAERARLISLQASG